MTPMTDLVEFLRARLDEDAALARQAARGPWKRDYHAAFMHGIKDADGRSLLVNGLMESDNVRHVVRHNPARALAEVEAKRRIVDECAYWDDKLTQEAADPPKYPQPGLGERLEVAMPILRLLALPYADHPEYREEWRP